MSEYDHLGLIAEIAATLLGFVSIFLVLSGKNGRFSKSDRHFIQAFVLCSAFAIMFGILPGVLSTISSDAFAWHTSRNLGLVCAVVITYIMLRHQLTMSSEESSDYSWWWHIPSWSLGSLGTAFNLMTFLQPQYLTGYFTLGVSCMIPISLWCFIALVFRRYF